MFLRLEPNASEPLYQQMARQLRQRIAGGQLKPGEQLPSARELSAELGVNFLTVVKVYQLLEQEGLVEMRRGLGTFVAPQSAKQRATAREELLDGLIDTLLRGAEELGASHSEVLHRLREKLEP
jgi:GntR family transcriptional regulator